MVVLASLVAVSTLLLIGGSLWTLHRAGRLRERPDPARGLALGGHLEVPLSVAIGWVRRREPVALPFLTASLGAAGVVYGLGALALLLAIRERIVVVAAVTGFALVYATVRTALAILRAARAEAER